MIPGLGRFPAEGIGYPLQYSWSSLMAIGKESASNVGDLGSIPGLGRFPGGRHGNPLCGVHGVTNSQTQLSDWAQDSKLVTQSRPTLCNPWTDCTDQAPLSIEFSRKEYLSGLPFPPPEDPPDPGIEPSSLGRQVFLSLASPRKPPTCYNCF